MEQNLANISTRIGNTHGNDGCDYDLEIDAQRWHAGISRSAVCISNNDCYRSVMGGFGTAFEAIKRGAALDYIKYPCKICN